MADNGHDITMSARLGPQNAKAILSIMVCDALDETGKYLLQLILGGVFHILDSRNASPNVAMWVSAAISLLSIFGCARSRADGYALVSLYSLLAPLRLPAKETAGIENV
jgi:hypothetical protein